jgi:hypothetical protein
MQMMRVICCLSALAIALATRGCSTYTASAPTPGSPHFVAKSWPAADALFHQDPHWLGADSAWSIDLGAGRVLWLFGDTFVDPSDAPSRTSDSVSMISNTVAIQQGYNPTRAAITFFWRTGDDGAPAPFFPDEGEERIWPGHGARIGDTLVLFLMHVRSTDVGIGFEVFDWSAVAVSNPDESPDAWNITPLVAPDNDLQVIVGSSGMLVDNDFLYALGSLEPGRGQIYLTRWPAASVADGDMSAMQWWGRAGEWICNDEAYTDAAPVFTHFGTECTVHYDAPAKRYLNIRTLGFGDADIMFRTAPALTGPWTADGLLYRPPEFGAPGVMIYSGKAHPSLTGADLVVTYCTNAFEFGDLVQRNELYYPRFVRLDRTP